MGITLDEVAAIGDNDNDAVMLEAAGISGCVANGNSTGKRLLNISLPVVLRQVLQILLNSMF